MGQNNFETAGKTEQTNTGRLCSVWCPTCGRVTEKISFNLIREAKSVKVACPACGGLTFIDYKDKTPKQGAHVELSFLPGRTVDMLSDMAAENRKKRAP
jgi:predicted RNA-binding Zn-ribbon protein involved in translation (DUF1610 family)